jgi:hypothetical protein
MFRFLLLGIMTVMVSACAEPAQVQNIVATAPPSTSGSPLEKSMCVKSVTGGEATNPLWTSEVDDAGFRGALEGSLRNAGLAAASASDCKLDVTANLLGLAQPAAGFDMEVIANVNYSVLNSGTDNAYFESTVVTPFTADFSSAFAGVTRLRLANEGAIRTNITEFMNRVTNHAKTDPPVF